MDGFTMKALVRELSTTLTGAKIEKIHQPSERDLVLTIRALGQNQRLLISANHSQPRVHFLGDKKPENPSEPPTFCMTLRKHLEGGRILAVRQQAWDRVIEWVIEHVNELGDRVHYVLIAELMGKHSNLILTIGEPTASASPVDVTPGKIVTAMVYVSIDMSRVRQVLPGLVYSMPPQQEEKVSPSVASQEQLTGIQWHNLTNRANVMELVHKIAGMGPITAKEILFRANATSQQLELKDTLGNNNECASSERILKSLQEIVAATEKCLESAVVALDDLGRPVACAPFHLTSSTNGFRACASMSEAILTLHEHVAEKMQFSSLRTDLARVVEQHLDKLRGKLVKIREAEGESEFHNQLRIYGELLTAYLYQVEKGQTSVSLPNFYDDEKYISIALDPALTANENAQRYFRQSQKRKRSIAILADERRAAETDMRYLEEVSAHLQESTLKNLEDISTELVQEGFLKAKAKRNRGKLAKSTKTQSAATARPDEYLSSDGLCISVGRNNAQNDRLTLKSSRPNDLWLHVKEQPGSHVVIRKEGNDIPESTVHEAALLAVYFSKARDSANISVDVTEIKNIWKPNGARPGHVLYDSYHTLFVNPDRTLIEPILTRRVGNSPSLNA